MTNGDIETLPFDTKEQQANYLMKPLTLEVLQNL